MILDEETEIEMVECFAPARDAAVRRAGDTLWVEIEPSTGGDLEIRLGNKPAGALSWTSMSVRTDRPNERDSNGEIDPFLTGLSAFTERWDQQSAAGQYDLWEPSPGPGGSIGVARHRAAMNEVLVVTETDLTRLDNGERVDLARAAQILRQPARGAGSVEELVGVVRAGLAAAAGAYRDAERAASIEETHGRRFPEAELTWHPSPQGVDLSLGFGAEQPRPATDSQVAAALGLDQDTWMECRQDLERGIQTVISTGPETLRYGRLVELAEAREASSLSAVSFPTDRYTRTHLPKSQDETNRRPPLDSPGSAAAASIAGLSFGQPAAHATRVSNPTTSRSAATPPPRVIGTDVER